MGKARRSESFGMIRTAGTVLIAVLALFIPSGTDEALAAAEAALPLTVTPAAWHGGELPTGTEYDLEFQIRNREPRDIRLIYIHAECDCTLTLPDEGVVPAEGDYRLAVRLSLDGFAPGPLDEAITILTDHPRQPEIRIVVTATVIPAADTGRPDHAGG